MTSSFSLLVHGGMHGAWCWERVIRLFPVRGDGERRVVDVERLVVLL